ncbi:MAG: glycosyltransferase family 9 protein [Promethearchaeota archaeon]|jgi:heptosyltransferase-2
MQYSLFRCIPSTKNIFESSPYVDSVIEFDKRGKHRSFVTLIKFCKQLKKTKYNKVYSPHRSFRSSIITLLTRVKETYGFDNSSLKFAYSNIINYDHNVHEVKRNLNLVDDNYSKDRWKILPELKISADKKERITEYLKSNDLNKFVAIALGSVWETKKYPAHYYLDIVEYLINNSYKIVLIGGASDKSLCDELRQSNTTNIINAAGNFSFVETVELLISSSLLICNDSAPTHLGMCANIPVITIYCSTVPTFGFYPYNEKSTIISYDDLECKPCGIHGFNKCPINTFDCGEFLSPNIIIEEINKILGNE